MSHFLQGNKISLRTFNLEENKKLVLEWLNNKETTKHLFRGTYPTHEDSLQSTPQTAGGTPTNIEFLLYHNELNQPFGLLGLHDIEWLSKVAELRILIGDPKFTNKGYGTEATQLLCCYGFEILNLHKINLGFNAKNTAAQKTYEKTGFTQEGLFKKEFFRLGEYHDLIRMGMLKERFESIKNNWPIYKIFMNQYSN